MAEIPKDVQDRLKPLLASIARLFRAPRITLIVRAPDVGNVKGDMVIGNDDPTSVIGALRARMVDEAEIYAGTPERLRVAIKERSVVKDNLQSDPLPPRAIPKDPGNGRQGS